MSSCTDNMECAGLLDNGASCVKVVKFWRPYSEREKTMIRHSGRSISGRCFIATAATLLLFASPSRAQQPSPPAVQISQDEQAVRAVLDSWLKALERGDTAALKRIIAEDYLISVSDGRILNREEDLAPIVAGKLQFLSAKTDSVRIRVFGNAAIVTGVGAYTVKMGDKSMVIRERFTDVYIKRDGVWHPVSSHSTPLRG